MNTGNEPTTPVDDLHNVAHPCDLFESRVAQLQFIALGLHGGYYEQVNATCGNVKPKSNRDVWLANRIDELVVQCEFVRMNLDK